MSIIKRFFCKHEYEFVRNIYGDEINHTGGRRSWWRCKKCGKWLLMPMLEDDEREITGDTSDGFHTFNELYHHRAILFSVIVRDHQELAWKSKLHHDGTMYDGMFIVGIDTPSGQATYHYDIDPYWDMFECKELDRAPEWDGHTPDDAIERIATLGSGTCEYCKDGKFDGQTVMMTNHGWQRINFCPHCGRKVADE